MHKSTKWIIVAFTVAMSFFLTSICLHGQTKINPTNQINWPLITGSGIPTLPCTSINYGQPYQNTAATPNAYYTCGTDGWAIRGSVGTVTSLSVGSGWPSWLTPSIADPTTTPSLSVALTTIPNAALQNTTMTINGADCVLGGSCTLPLYCAGAGCPNYNQYNTGFSAGATLDLSANVSSTSLVIPVVSTTGFPSTGCAVMVAPVENFCWDSKTTNTLVINNVSERGVNGTPAESHVTGNPQILGIYYSQAPCPTCTQSITILSNSVTGFDGAINPGLTNSLFLPDLTLAVSRFEMNGGSDAGSSFGVEGELGLNWTEAYGHIANGGGYAARLQHNLSTTATNDLFAMNVYSPSGTLLGPVFSWNGNQVINLATGATVAGSPICTTANAGSLGCGGSSISGLTPGFLSLAATSSTLGDSPIDNGITNSGVTTDGLPLYVDPTDGSDQTSLVVSAESNSSNSDIVDIGNFTGSATYFRVEGPGTASSYGNPGWVDIGKGINLGNGGSSAPYPSHSICGFLIQDVSGTQDCITYNGAGMMLSTLFDSESGPFITMQGGYGDDSTDFGYNNSGTLTTNMRVTSNGVILSSITTTPSTSPICPNGTGGALTTTGCTGGGGGGATISVGTTTTLSAGSPATVTNSGTSTAAILNFGIPQGFTGSGGGSTSGAVLLAPATATNQDIVQMPGTSLSVSKTDPTISPSGLISLNTTCPGYGFSFGNDGSSAQGWSTCSALDINLYSAANGIDHGVTTEFTHDALGDAYQDYSYNAFFGNGTAASNEGVGWKTGQIHQVGFYTGTISGGSVGDDRDYGAYSTGTSYVNTKVVIPTNGNLGTITASFHGGTPTAGQPATFFVATNNGGGSFTITNTIPVTLAATAGLQTFTSGTSFTPVAVTAGQVVGIYVASGIPPAYNSEGGTYQLAGAPSIGTAAYAALTVGDTGLSLNITMAAPTTGSTSILTSNFTCNGYCLALAGSNFAQGGIMLDESEGSSVLGLAASNNTGISPIGLPYYTLTSGTVSVSTAWGNIISSSCTGNTNGQSITPTSTTCNVQLASASPGSFTSGTDIFLSRNNVQEESLVTAVGATTSGVQSITFSTINSWTAGNAAVMQGGPGSQAIVPTNWLTKNWPIANMVMGAFSPTELAYSVSQGTPPVQSSCNNTYTVGQPYFSVFSIVRASNVVTMINGGPSAFCPAIGSTVTITGATPSDLNGTFTVTYNSYDNTAPELQWAQTGANETGTGSLTITNPTPTLTMYPAALILGSNNGNSGTAQLGTNNVPWALGDSVVGSPIVSYDQTGVFLVQGQSGPGNYASAFFNLADQGTNGQAIANDFNIQNTSGGISANLMNVSGGYSNYFYFEDRPAGNGYLITVGAADPVSSNPKPYGIFQDKGSASSKFMFNPAAGAFTMTGSLTADGLGDSALLNQNCVGTNSVGLFVTGTCTGSGIPYPGAGIPNSTGSAWGTSYGTTGSGSNVVLATSPTLVTPILGTPSAVNLANATNIPSGSLVGGIPASLLPYASASSYGAVECGTGTSCSGGVISVSGTDTLSSVRAYYVDTFPATCTVDGTSYTTQADCAWATADLFVITADGQYGAKLIFGANYYQKNIEWIEPTSTNGQAVSFQGSGMDSTYIIQTTSTPSSPMLSNPEQYGNLSTFDISDLTFAANGNADSCADLVDIISNNISRVNCTGIIDGSDHAFQIGESGRNAQEVVMDHVFGGGDVGNPSTRAQVTATVSGGVPTFTIVNGGAGYPSSDVQVYLTGVGAGDHPCTTMGTSTATVSSGVVTAITSSATGCVSPMYVQVYPVQNIAAGFRLYMSDSTAYDLYSQGAQLGIDVEFGNTKLVHPHPTNEPVGIKVTGNDDLDGVECDTIGKWCIDFEGTSQVSVEHTTGYTGLASSIPGYSAFHFGTSVGPVEFVGLTDLCAAGTPAGYHEFINTTGAYSATNPLPAGSDVVGNDAQCPTTVGDIFSQPALFSNTTTIGGLTIVGSGITTTYGLSIAGNLSTVTGSFLYSNGYTVEGSASERVITPEGMALAAVGTAIASAATIAPISPITHVTGTATVSTITVPTGCGYSSHYGCTITLISDGGFAFTTGGNIAAAETTVTGHRYAITYDQNTSLWYPQ